MKNILFITMLLGFGYSECNESNWEEYYPNMGWCDLFGANLSQTNLSGAYCYGAFFVYADLEGTNFDGADLQYAYFDENEDEYDDVSYDAGATSGDLNLDGTDNIQDIITLVNNILNP